MKRLACLAILLLFLAACAAPAPVHNDPTTQHTTQVELTTAAPAHLERAMSDNLTVFVSGGHYHRENELWLRNETTGEETLLHSGELWRWHSIGQQLNERFFVFSEGWMGGVTTMIYDLDERRVITVQSAGQAHPSCIRFHAVDGGRVYLNMGHGGVRSFDISELESGEPIMLPCDMPPVFLVTGELADVREITVARLDPAAYDAFMLSSAQWSALFAALRNVDVRVVMHPLHHSYGVAQMGREFRVEVHYADGHVDAIVVEPSAFRMIDVADYGGRAFVIGTEVEQLTALLERLAA
ncbi:MAG: hypothetical protein FWB76_02205 [Oscillospiraceae bacterium]|nr:hypothetical protein [Oscillospiraceae bacterium]